MTPAALKALAMGEDENFIAATTPGGIEAQEKRGQIEQSFRETLPKDGTSGEKRKPFETLGFVFGADADDIFVNATFPKGWRKKVTRHDMWSELVDDKDRKRGSIFYKAAFYDRSAHVHLSQRFSIGRYQDNRVTILDCEEVSHVIGKYEQGDYETMDRLEGEAKAWLAKNYPNWNNVSAYWD